jgi:hypothetical protein
MSDFEITRDQLVKLEYDPICMEVHGVNLSRLAYECRRHWEDSDESWATIKSIREIIASNNGGKFPPMSAIVDQVMIAFQKASAPAMYWNNLDADALQKQVLELQKQVLELQGKLSEDINERQRIRAWAAGTSEENAKLEKKLDELDQKYRKVCCQRDVLIEEKASIKTALEAAELRIEAFKVLRDRLSKKLESMGAYDSRGETKAPANAVMDTDGFWRVDVFVDNIWNGRPPNRTVIDYEGKTYTEAITDLNKRVCRLEERS